MKLQLPRRVPWWRPYHTSIRVDFGRSRWRIRHCVPFESWLDRHPYLILPAFLRASRGGRRPITTTSAQYFEYMTANFISSDFANLQ